MNGPTWPTPGPGVPDPSPDLPPSVYINGDRWMSSDEANKALVRQMDESRAAEAHALSNFAEVIRLSPSICVTDGKDLGPDAVTVTITVDPNVYVHLPDALSDIENEIADQAARMIRKHLEKWRAKHRRRT